MKRTSVILLLLLCLTSFVVAETNSVLFSDVSSHWSQAWVNALVEREITSGYPDGTFKPDNTVSVEEFITFTVKALQNIDSEKYAITPGDYWSDGFVNVALNYHLIEIGEFDSMKRPIKREEMASIIIKAYGMENVIANSSINTDVIDMLHDYTLISDYYKDSMLNAVREGFITGKSEINNKIIIDPKGTATRGEAAVLLIKLLDADKRSPVALERPSAIFEVDRYNGNILTPIELTYYAKKNSEGKYVTEIIDYYQHIRSMNNEQYHATWLSIGESIPIDFKADNKYERYYNGMFWYADRNDVTFKFNERALSGGFMPFTFTFYKEDWFLVDYDTYFEYLMGEHGEEINYLLAYFFEDDAKEVLTKIEEGMTKSEIEIFETTWNGRDIRYKWSSSGFRMDFKELGK